MTSSTGYVEAVQRRSYGAGRVRFFLTKAVKSTAQRSLGMTM